MARSVPALGVLLPKQWPQRVRSTIVNANSLARVTLTVARGFAANDRSVCTRLRTENDRLRQELGLLREEMP